LSTSQPLSDRERLDWLRLIRSDNVGPVTFGQLLRRFGSAAEALAALPDLARRGGRKTLHVCSADAAEAEIDKLAAADARLIARCEAEYPPGLTAVDDAPPLLAVRGQIEILRQRSVGMVGARNASANGIRFARQLATELGASGLAVVSGLARGIDAAAHRGSLVTGTVGVLAGGVDIVYPAENQGLYEEIVARGAVVSEMPPGLQPQARHFPQRNRIVAGMALGVVVVEAALKSGSLITARLALEYGREVFAVPGSPLDPRARGSNDLLRQGAVLTESADDVIQALGAPAGMGPMPTPAAAPQPADSDIESALSAVLEKLGPAPTPVDELIRQCHLPPPVIHMALLELELAGRLTRHPGNLVSLS
jgi:DNA processing protein